MIKSFKLEQYARIETNNKGSQTLIVYKGIDSIEEINAPYHKFDYFTGNDYTEIDRHWYDKNNRFKYSGKNIPKNTIIEVIQPYGYSLLDIEFDKDRIEFEILYSSKLNHLRFIFHIKEFMKFVFIEAVQVKDVHQILERTKSTKINSTARKQLHKELIKPLAPKKESLRKDFGKFIILLKKGLILNQQDFEDKLKVISSKYKLINRSTNYLFEPVNKKNPSMPGNIKQEPACEEIKIAYDLINKNTISISLIKKFWNER